MIGDAVVVGVAACNESKGGAGTRSGSVSNETRHGWESAWRCGFNGHPWRWVITKCDAMRLNLNGLSWVCRMSLSPILGPKCRVGRHVGDNLIC